MERKNVFKLIYPLYFLMIFSLIIGIYSCEEDDPILSTDATLSTLTIDGTAVTGFIATTLTYDHELVYGTTEVPVVAATSINANATVTITDAISLPGSTTVLVTAEDGSTTLTYTINFTLGPNLDYENADGIMGGKLYSKFWADETGWTVPGGITEAEIDDYGNFYRCKQCHGWDLDGKTGAYIDRGPNTGRPDVAISIRSVISSKTTQELFDAVKYDGGRAVDPLLTNDGTNGNGNPMPDYGLILTDAQIWDIVKFLKEEAFDVSQLYDLVLTGTYPDGDKEFTNIGKDGNADSGDTYYASKCVSCHGANGTLLDLEGKSIGGYIRDKPYETQHKVKFGHLGSSMTGFPDATLTDVKNLFVAGTDTISFPDL